MPKFYKPSEVAELLNYNKVTIIRWIHAGKINAIKIGRDFRIPEEEVQRLLGKKKETMRAVLYARVSGKDQKKDLETQLKTLEQYAISKGYQIVEEVKEIASGLNENRKGLKKLITLAKNGEYDVLLITYPDRLTRFGFKYLEELFSAYNVRIETIFKKDKTPREELVKDLITIITSFAGRLYELRSHKNKRFVQEFKKLLAEVENK
ncbi:resolvase related protein [Pyrococcus sp. NA2]|uniref:IS607 family transposase n=1 Tax=Pyrococcus sp. (strain NA2) TaxID=342949 RepID=UPI000209AC25|nr:IS607 family transposase [Pyrococcus sp. NA2]AEC51523.1 resolvase related protein [Pyrococcus sp. NA2]